MSLDKAFKLARGIARAARHNPIRSITALSRYTDVASEMAVMAEKVSDGFQTMPSLIRRFRDTSQLGTVELQEIETALLEVNKLLSEAGKINKELLTQVSRAESRSLPIELLDDHTRVGMQLLDLMPTYRNALQLRIAIESDPQLAPHLVEVLEHLTTKVDKLRSVALEAETTAFAIEQNANKVSMSGIAAGVAFNEVDQFNNWVDDNNPIFGPIVPRHEQNKWIDELVAPAVGIAISEVGNFVHTTVNDITLSAKPIEMCTPLISEDQEQKEVKTTSGTTNQSNVWSKAEGNQSTSPSSDETEICELENYDPSQMTLRP
jgi:hypothetical protein